MGDAVREALPVTDTILGVLLGVGIVVAFFLALPWLWTWWDRYFSWIERRNR